MCAQVVFEDGQRRTKKKKKMMMMKKRKEGGGVPRDKNSTRYRRKIKTNDANLQNDDPKSQTCRARRGAKGEAPRSMHRSGGKRSLLKRKNRIRLWGRKKSGEISVSRLNTRHLKYR